MDACTCARAKLAPNEHFWGCPWVASFKATQCPTDNAPSRMLTPPKRVPYQRPKNLPKPTVRKPAAEEGERAR